MPGSVYIETTIPSAYFSARADPSSLHRKQSTREWWDRQLPLYDIVASDNVLIELRRGIWDGQAEAIALIEPLPRLVVDAEVLNVAARYVDERLIPDDLGGDATHLALACIHEMDFLLTWNIRHLANPNKTEHLTVINRRLGLLSPQIVTPDMLWLEDF